LRVYLKDFWFSVFPVATEPEFGATERSRGMRVFNWLAMVAVVTGVVLPAAAQVEPPGLMTKSFTVDVEPGEVLQFEAALREHLTAGVVNDDPWAWYTWQVIVGRDFGQYIVRSHGHHWQEFDARAELDRLDRADFMATVAGHTTSIASTIERFEPTISNWPPDLERPALVSATRYDLTFGGVREFVAAVEKLHRAVAEKAPERHYAWLTTVSGSEGPTMTLAVPRANWADFEPRQPPLWDIVAEVYGEAEAQSIRDTIGGAVRSTSSSVLRLREDLSYEPEK
jgi:hypothetical protein